MDEREIKVIVQNVLKYEDKKNNGVLKSRLGYILNSSDAFQNSENFKGIAELSYFSDSTDLFDKLTTEHMGKAATLKFKKVVNPRNPIKDSLKLLSIQFKDETIDLL